MKDIITKDEIKKILKPYTIYERVCMDYKGNISLGVTDKGMLAQEIISKINEKTRNNDFRVIAKGKVTQVNCYYEDGALIGGEGVTDLLGPYENKNIELGIRKVK